MRTYAGIVLFNPEIERLQENIFRIYNQVDEVMLIDNGSENIDSVEKLVKSLDKVIIVKNAENKGIAFALNQIINYGEKNGYTWGLTLDQDSICDTYLVEKYIDFIQMHKQLEVGCLTCNIVDRNFNLDDVDIGMDDYREIDYCITSGSFMNIKATKSIGGFDSSMFIDKVDCDICINLRKHGFKIVKIDYNGLLHEVGHAKQISLGYRKWELYNHSSFRRYYMCKNASYLLKKYHDGYVFKIFLKEIFQTFLVLLFENNKRKKLLFGVKGFIEGF